MRPYAAYHAGQIVFLAKPLGRDLAALVERPSRSA